MHDRPVIPQEIPKKVYWYLTKTDIALQHIKRSWSLEHMYHIIAFNDQQQDNTQNTYSVIPSSLSKTYKRVQNDSPQNMQLHSNASCIDDKAPH